MWVDGEEGEGVGERGRATVASCSDARLDSPAGAKAPGEAAASSAWCGWIKRPPISMADSFARLYADRRLKPKKRKQMYSTRIVDPTEMVRTYM